MSNNQKLALKSMAATIAFASLGGAVEVIVTGAVPGLGTYVESDRKLDARLGGAMMGIQSPSKKATIGPCQETVCSLGTAPCLLVC